MADAEPIDFIKAFDDPAAAARYAARLTEMK